MDDPLRSPDVSRRRAIQVGALGTVAAAAWAAPSVLTLDSAFALCSNTVNLAMTSPTNSGGWLQTVVTGAGGAAGRLGVITFPGTGGGVGHIVEKDPTTAPYEVKYCKSFTASTGSTYTFTFRTYIRTVNPVSEVLRLILTEAGKPPVVIFNRTTALGNPATSLGPDQATRTWTATFTATKSGAVQYCYHQSLATVGVGDDITVTGPTVACA